MSLVKKSFNFLSFVLRFLSLKFFNRTVSLAGFPRIGRGCFFSERLPISINKNFYCGQFCYFSGRIIIGEGVMCASNVAFVGGDHKFDGASEKIYLNGREDYSSPTIIGDYAWIGHGVIIKNGTKIGRGAVVGAGSVVTKDVEDYEVVAGNPARRIRFRNITSNINN